MLRDICQFGKKRVYFRENLSILNLKTFGKTFLDVKNIPHVENFVPSIEIFSTILGKSHPINEKLSHFGKYGKNNKSYTKMLKAVSLLTEQMNLARVSFKIDLLFTFVQKPISIQPRFSFFGDGNGRK